MSIDDSTAKEKTTKRLAHLGRIDREDDIHNLMLMSGNFFPSIVKIDEAHHGSEIVIGSYIYSLNTGLGAGGFGFGRMIEYHHPVAYQASAEPTGISKYFRITGDGTKYTIDDSTTGNSILAAIDEYELAQEKISTRIRSKAYINLSKKIIAAYVMGDSGKLSIVEFEK